MDPVFLLTPLRESGHNFKAAERAGEWLPLTGTLGELGGALDVPDSARVDVVRSTPDPWAQARSFADAILHPSPLLTSVIGQWRGLLALFALKDRYQDVYDLTLEPVELAGGKSLFASVMTSLLPRFRLPAGRSGVSDGWERPILVRLSELGPDRQPLSVEGGRPIALLNPASLIAAGRDVERLHIARIPWMKQGLTDPTKLEGEDALHPAILKLLADHLQTLERDLRDHCLGGEPAEKRLLENLVRQLQHYQADCLDEKRVPGIKRLRVDIEPADPWGDGLPALYALLTTPKKIKAPPPGTSDCIIRLRDDLGAPSPFQGLVLLDPAIATAKRPASQITFWGLTSLHEALSLRENIQTLRKTIAKSGYLLVEPKDFFTRVLVKLDDDERPGRIAAHHDSLADSLLPLSPLALLVLKPEEYLEKVSLKRDGRLTLQLSLSSVADGETAGTYAHALGRRFTARPSDGEGQLLSEVDWGLGDFAVWPDFRSDIWQQYSARIDYSPNNLNRLRGRFALSGRLLSNRLGTQEDGDEKADLLASWTDSRPIDNHGNGEQLDRVREFAERAFTSPELTRMRSRNSGGNASEIQISKHAFEAAFFTILTDREPTPVPAGLAVLKLKNPPPANAEGGGDIAIDFGTTNTVACMNSQEPLTLQSRIVHPVAPGSKNGGATGDITFKFRDFLPPDERSLPTPTVLMSRSLDGPAREMLEQDKALNDHLLIRHLIYFQPDFAADGRISGSPIDEWTSLLRNLRFNLKWSDAPDMIDTARRYLRQLMLMISAEWIMQQGSDPRSLDWHFSRPEHMGEERNQSFRNELQNALVNILPGVSRDRVQKLKSEGVSAATYFLSENSQSEGTRGTLNLILDIGGGTTDMAAWDNSSPPQLLWSDSVRLAGGDFFTNHIMCHPELLDQFGLTAWSGVISRLSKETDTKLQENVRYVGELLFSGNTLSSAIDRQWSRVSGTREVAHLRETAFVFLGGVAWYIGRELRNKLRSGAIEAAALQDVSVALCGRGSNLFARLHGPAPRERTDISRLMLLAPFAAGEGKPKFPQVHVSHQPKIEVAAGMIIGARRGGGDDRGPSLDLDRVDLSEEETAPARGPLSDDIAEEYPALPLHVGIEDLDLFLRILAKVVGLKVTLEPEHRAKIINGFAEVDREDVAAGRQPQAEFAVALKVLVDLMRARAESKVRPKTEWVKPAA